MNRVVVRAARASSSVRPLATSTFCLRRFSTSVRVASQTHFGYRVVDEAEKASLVANVFHNVANNYDLMNDLMSGTIHRYWKDEFINMLHPVPGTQLLDVAGGTGDIAFRFLEAIKSSPLFVPSVSPPSSVTVCDINGSMIEVGKSRAAAKGYSSALDADPSIRWLVGDAENLPLPSESVDAYTIAFGIRNCTHVDRVLREAYRVLRRGGRFMCLEFSHIDTSQLPLLPSLLPELPPLPFLSSPSSSTASTPGTSSSGGGGTSPSSSSAAAKPLDALLQAVYDAYSFAVIPELGKRVAGDEQSYRYLVESIRRFPRQADFAAMIEREGFSSVSYTNLTLGVAAIHSGFKLR